MVDVMTATAAELGVIEPDAGIGFITTGAELPATLKYDKWALLVEELFALERAHRWWIGDVLNFGEAHYGEKYAQAIDLTGVSYDTLADYCYVARSVPLATRVEGLSWSHHKAVAPLDAAEQRRWLDRALAANWTVRDLKENLRPLVLPAPTPEPAPAPAPARAGTYAFTTPADDDRPTAVVDTIPDYIDAEYEVLADEVLVMLDELFGSGYERVTDLNDLARLGERSDCAYIDVRPEHQAQAAQVIVALLEATAIRQAVFVCDLHPADDALLDLWPWSTCLLSDAGNLFYVGPYRSAFAERFGEMGVVVQLFR